MALFTTRSHTSFLFFFFSFEFCCISSSFFFISFFSFFCFITDFPKCDLLLVMGTSLQVQPFASLVTRVTERAVRLLVNREVVGTGGGGFDFSGGRTTKQSRDAKWLGDVQEGVRLL